MPAEPTKTKLKRRSSRKDLEDYHLDGGQTRELEQKRSRGQFLSLLASLLLLTSLGLGEVCLFQSFQVCEGGSY